MGSIPVRVIQKSPSAQAEGLFLCKPDEESNRAADCRKVPSSRHVRMDGTHTGKFAAESVQAALRRVRGSAANFVPRGSGGEAHPVDETASRRWRSAPIFASARAPRKSAKRKRIGGKEFLTRVCGQKWVPPKAWRFCDTLSGRGGVCCWGCYSVGLGSVSSSAMEGKIGRAHV